MAIIRTGSQTEYIRQGGVRLPTPVGVAQAPVSNPVEGMAGGLIRAAVDGGGKLGELLARGYREHQTERLEEESLRVEREFTEFRNEWTRENKGIAARDAGQVFAQKHEELAKEASERLNVGEDEIYLSELRKKMGHQNLYALRDGLQYARAEENRYSESVWNGQLASFQRMAEEHPEDGDALRVKCGELLDAWRRNNPGLDDTAIRMQLEEMAGTRRVDTLIAQGRLAEARAALGESVSGAQDYSAGGASLPGGARPGNSQAGAKRGTSIAEAQCNPLNLKKVGHNGRSRNDFESFASDGDGFRAAWRQLKIYQNGRRKLKTPAEMIRTWAPAKDGNDLAKYFATVKSVGGIDVNAPIDINDPQQAARLIKAMAVMESPLGNRYSNADVQAMLSESKGITRQAPQTPRHAAGGGEQGQVANGDAAALPVYTGSAFGISPLKNARYQRQIEALEKQQLHEERVKFQQPLDDYFAKCAAGVVVDAPFSNAEIAARFGEQATALIERMEAEGTYALDVNAIKIMSGEEQALLLESRKPEAGDDHYKERLDRYTRLERAIAENQKERADAPAYVMAAFPEVKSACEKFLTDMTPENFNGYITSLKSQTSALGLPEPDTDKLFSAEVCQSLADYFAQSENPAATLQVFQQATGRYYGQMMRQLAPKWV